MKRIKLMMLLILAILAGMARADYARFCGVQMGMTKEQVKKILRDRFGYSSVSENSGDISVVNGSVGGINYKFMDFHFTWINRIAILNGAEFSTPFEIAEKKDAINLREMIKSVYGEKYIIEPYTNDDGFKSYHFGDDDEIYGSIMLIKAKGKDGRVRYYVMVVYFGPYNNVEDI